MNINSLIPKHGEAATLNGVAIFAYIDEENVSSQKKFESFKAHTGLYMCSVLVREKCEDADLFIIGGTRYLVFKSKEIRKNGVRVYSDCVLFKDDFVNAIKIYTQTMKMSGCNLPSLADEPYNEVNARIKSVKPSDYLQYSLHTGKVPTHTISMLFDDGVGIADYIEWGDRAFEVLDSENVDEQDRLLIVNVIEVLNA